MNGQAEEVSMDRINIHTQSTDSFDDIDYIDDDEEEEISFVDNGESCSEAVKQIEEVFEVLEEVVLNDDFGAMQLEFCKKNCHIFDSEEENKLEYMDLFKEYTQMLEEFIERELKMRIDDFVMDDFLAILAEYSSELEGEIFELLLTMTDFDHFKEFMLDCRNGDETELGIDFSLKGDGLCANDLGDGSSKNMSQSEDPSNDKSNVFLKLL